MNVNGVSGAAALWFKTVEMDPSEALNALVDSAATGKTDAANPAASNTSFPTGSPTQIDSASILMMQGGDEAGSKSDGPSATDEFLAYMKKTPEERMRENILKSMGITEEELEGMPPEQRKAVEEKIQEIIKERITPVGTPGFHVSDPEQLPPSLKQMLDVGAFKAKLLSLNPADDLA